MKLLLALIFIFNFINASSIEYTNQEKDYLKNKKIIKMCVDPDWEPFEKINKHGIHEGLASDLIRLISKRGNLNIQLVKTKNWKESLKYSKERKCDILSFLNDTPKRRQWLTFTNPLFSDPNVLVGRIERDYIEDISKENLSIALPKGTSVEEKFIKEFPNMAIVLTENEQQAFSLVENKKVDVTLRSLIVTAHNIKKKGLFNLKIVGEVKGYENHLRIGVRNDETILKDILNKSIATINQKDIDKIVNNHVTVVIQKIKKYTIAFWVLGVLALVIFLILLWNYLLNKQVKKEVEKNIEQEKKLFQVARQAEISQLIANISHQWKNGLTQISALNLEMTLMNQFDEKINRDDLENILKNSEKSIEFMNNTMNVFLNFYKGIDNIENFSIKSSIEDVLQIIDMRLKELKVDLTIKENYEKIIEGNKNEWLHIWLNLINNSITASNYNNKKNELSIKITINKNEILYTDNAGGFNQNTLDKIAENNCIGLGLKMTKDILEKHHYNLSINNKNDGAIFNIFEKN
jgi:ABC-type amino acid transport substrate-binding protein